MGMQRPQAQAAGQGDPSALGVPWSQRGRYRGLRGWWRRIAAPTATKEDLLLTPAERDLINRGELLGWFIAGLLGGLLLINIGTILEGYFQDLSGISAAIGCLLVVTLVVNRRGWVDTAALLTILILFAMWAGVLSLDAFAYQGIDWINSAGFDLLAVPCLIGALTLRSTLAWIITGVLVIAEIALFFSLPHAPGLVRVAFPSVVMVHGRPSAIDDFGASVLFLTKPLALQMIIVAMGQLKSTQSRRMAQERDRLSGVDVLRARLHGLLDQAEEGKRLILRVYAAFDQGQDVWRQHLAPGHPMQGVTELFYRLLDRLTQTIHDADVFQQAVAAMDEWAHYVRALPTAIGRDERQEARRDALGLSDGESLPVPWGLLASSYSAPPSAPRVGSRTPQAVLLAQARLQLWLNDFTSWETWRQQRWRDALWAILGTLTRIQGGDFAARVPQSAYVDDLRPLAHTLNVTLDMLRPRPPRSSGADWVDRNPPPAPHAPPDQGV